MSVTSEILGVEGLGVLDDGDASVLLERFIEKECMKYSTYEQARVGFTTIIGQIKNLQINVDRNLLETLNGKNEIKSQILGKRIYDEIKKIIHRHSVLRMVIQGDVDLTTLIGENLESEERVDDIRMLEQREVDNFPELCLMEIDTVEEFLNLFRVSSENTSSGISDLEKNLFPERKEDGYKTFILRGGLYENGRLTKEVIQIFDELYRAKGRNGALKTIDGRKSARESSEKLEMMETYYYREIWELEDEIGPEGYLRGEPLSMVTEKARRALRKMSEEEELAESVTLDIEQDYQRKLEKIKELVKRKWRERKVFATKVLQRQERSVGRKENGTSDHINIRQAVVVGYLDMISEICSKISSSADIQIRMELNRPYRDKARSKEHYSSLEKRNLTGVMMALKDKYGRAPLTMMFESLEELFLGNIGTVEPMKIMNWINSKMLMWSEFELFEYFVPDILFTFVTIFRLPNGPVRQRCSLAVLERMRERPEEFAVERLKERRSMGSELPLKILVEDIIRESKLAGNGLRGNSNNEKNYDQLNAPIKRVPEIKNVQTGQPQGVVAAHVATTTDQQQQRWLSKGEKYAEMVGRENNAWIRTAKGGMYPYTATTEACKKCRVGTVEQRHRSMCTLSKCSKCSLFGHREEECRQGNRGRA